MTDRYRAEAIRHRHGRQGSWQGKWRKDIAQAIAQAQRWQDNGMRGTLE
jgi:hypothetical protein